jgi:CheY-like chemotaxis protein
VRLPELHTRPALDFVTVVANPDCMRCSPTQRLLKRGTTIREAMPLLDPPKRTILCVDDTETEAEIRLLSSVLEKAGYRVLATRKAKEAVELIRSNEVDLVLAEHIMMNGTSLAERLKRLRPHVPIAIYSGDSIDPPGAVHYADRFITKLIPTDELLSTIKELLARNQMRLAA